MKKVLFLAFIALTQSIYCDKVGRCQDEGASQSTTGGSGYSNSAGSSSDGNSKGEPGQISNETPRPASRATPEEEEPRSRPSQPWNDPGGVRD